MTDFLESPGEWTVIELQSSFRTHCPESKVCGSTRNFGWY